MARKQCRERVIGPVVVVLFPDSGDFSVSPLVRRELTAAEKNAVTAWVVSELEYAGWEQDPVDVHVLLWRG